MKTLTSVAEIAVLATENGIVPAVQESAPIAQINPALLPAPLTINGRIGYQGQGWKLGLANGANPAALTGMISIMSGVKNEKPWKMLIVR
jgi:hypothetical protein